MKERFIAGTLAVLITLSLAGCGEVEDDAADSSSLQTTESTSSVVSDDSAAIEESSSVQETAPIGDENRNVVEIKLNTYRGEEVPELIKVVKETLKGASGSYEDYEKVFDPALLIEARIRPTVSSEEKFNELFSQYDDEAKKQTVKLNYELLHGILDGAEIKGDPLNMKIQTIDGDLASSMVFTLNFDVDTSKGIMTFLGSAYHVGDKWGAVFEPGEHRTESEILNRTEGKQNKDE